MFNTLLLRLMIWCGSRLYRSMVLYTPNGYVEAVTFTNIEWYARRVQDINDPSHA